MNNNSVEELSIYNIDMAKSDVEMEDAENFPHDKVANVQESENSVLDAKVANKGEEEVPSDAAVTGNGNKSENGGEVSCDLRKEAKSETTVNMEMEDQVNSKSKEAKNETTVNMEMEDQVNSKSEAVEPMNSEGPVGEQTNDEGENKDQDNAETKSVEETGAESAVEKQSDAKDELVEQSAANVRVEEQNSAENGVGEENRVDNLMEEEHSEVTAGKVLKESVREDGDCVENVAVEQKTMENAADGSDVMENMQLPNDISVSKALQSENGCLDEVAQGGDEKMNDEADVNEDTAVKDKLKEQVKEIVLASPQTDVVEAAGKDEGEDSSLPDKREAPTPNSFVSYSPSKAGDQSCHTVETINAQATPPLSFVEGGDGTPEDQAAFMKELESFYRERAMDFKPPKFYGKQLNCLKLWRSVIRLGGYDRVTGLKLWRQVGESFHPPKTCTTVSWTFRIFYEKSLLEYERHKTQSGALQLPVATISDSSGIDKEGNSYQGSESGRGRRDAAARAMQGWHVQQLFDNGEDKNLNNMPKREKSLKSICSLKQKRPNEVENSIKIARTETSKQLVPSVVDVGPRADWVKINVRQTKDCFEVYALVPGLLREEVRVQSDPAGRVVITGLPEQVDNPWGITPFKKVVTLPAPIDPLQTSAVVSLHGRLFVRVPFEQSNMKS